MAFKKMFQSRLLHVILILEKEEEEGRNGRRRRRRRRRTRALFNYTQEESSKRAQYRLLSEDSPRDPQMRHTHTTISSLAAKPHVTYTHTHAEEKEEEEEEGEKPVVCLCVLEEKRRKPAFGNGNSLPIFFSLQARKKNKVGGSPGAMRWGGD